MKHLVASVAGLGWREAVRHGLSRAAGLSFRPARSVFPALTCVAQGTLRTGLPPREHGMTANGRFFRDVRKPSFWEQSSALVSGPRVWDAARKAGRSVGVYFFQQSLGESVDFLVSPAHVHRHGGSSVLYRYTVPGEDDAALRRARGRFPLWRYWGPLAHPKAGDAVLADFLAAAEIRRPDAAFLYLPTLDYEAQRFGPDDPRCARAALRLRRQLETLAAFAEKNGADLTVFGEYSIAPVSLPPALPNAALRRAGLFAVREIGGLAYPDFHASRAFAMCDHEIAHVFVREAGDVRAVRDALAATGDYESLELRESGGEWAHPSAGELLAVAREGSWCAYPWWTDRREAPDYATHIDIHNKPGFDPCELFFERGFRFPPRICQDPARVRGTHGRARDVAVAASGPDLPGGSFLEAAASLSGRLCG